jgi:hypothetical protein
MGVYAINDGLDEMFSRSMLHEVFCWVTLPLSSYRDHQAGSRQFILDFIIVDS